MCSYQKLAKLGMEGESGRVEKGRGGVEGEKRRRGGGWEGVEVGRGLNGSREGGVVEGGWWKEYRGGRSVGEEGGEDEGKRGKG